MLIESCMQSCNHSDKLIRRNTARVRTQWYYGCEPQCPAKCLEAQTATRLQCAHPPRCCRSRAREPTAHRQCPICLRNVRSESQSPRVVPGCPGDLSRRFGAKCVGPFDVPLRRGRESRAFPAWGMQASQRACSLRTAARRCRALPAATAPRSRAGNVRIT